MKPPRGLTAFQARAGSMLEGVLSDLGIEAEFEYVKCTGQALGESKPDEYYVRAVAEVRGQLVEVFVYSDEIGFSSEGSWRIFESQDFAEESKMIDTALRELRLFINGPEIIAKYWLLDRCLAPSSAFEGA